MLKRLAYLLYILIFLCGITSAETTHSNKTFSKSISIDTGYLTANSNRAVGDFCIDILNGCGFLYDKGYAIFSPETLFGRATYNVGFWLLTLPIKASTLVTYHEFGHVRALNSMGFPSTFHTPPYTCNNWFTFWGATIFNGYFKNPFHAANSYAYSTYSLSNQAQNNMGNLKLYVSPENVTEYNKHQSTLDTLQSKLDSNPELMAKWNEAAKLSNLEDQYSLIAPYLTDKELEAVKYNDSSLQNNQHPLLPKAQIILWSSGVNNNVAMAQRVEDDIWFHQGHHHQITTNYFFDKLSTLLQRVYVYFNKSAEKNVDYAYVLSAWKNHYQQNYSIEDLASYSLFSYLLSSQTYMNIYQMYCTLQTGDPTVYPAEIKGFRMPNVGMYLTTLGPTYNIRSGYHFKNDLFLICSIEFLLNTHQQQIDYSLGFRKQFPEYGNMYIHAETTFNTKAFGGTAFIGREFANTLKCEAGITFHNANTFLGERNIPSLLKGDTDFEVWLKLGVCY